MAQHNATHTHYTWQVFFICRTWGGALVPLLKPNHFDIFKGKPRTKPLFKWWIFHDHTLIHPSIFFQDWVEVASVFAGCSRPPSHQRCFPAPHEGPKGTPTRMCNPSSASKAYLVTFALLDVPQRLLTRRPNHLYQISLDKKSKDIWMVKFLTIPSTLLP